MVDGVATVTINRPDRRNAMTAALLRDCYGALTAIASDSSVRIVVLTGAGMRWFCPGADMETSATQDRVGEVTDELRSDPVVFRVPVLLHEMPQLSVAAINGSVAGAGLGWACACDLRLASSSARFSTAFLDRAVAGDMALAWTLPRLVGAARARELSFLPEKFDAAEALRIGLVTRVFPEELFRSGVDDVVGRLQAAAPRALIAMKANYLAAERMSLLDFSDYESLRHMQMTSSADAREGFAAYIAGRAPRFIGQ